MRAQIPYDRSGRPAMVCMTAMQDVARFIVAALDLPNWPRELRMRGERMNVSDVVRVAERMRGTKNTACISLLDYMVLLTPSQIYNLKELSIALRHYNLPSNLLSHHMTDAKSIVCVH